MKRILLAVGALVVLVVVGVVVRFYVVLPEARAAPHVRAPETPEAMDRGRYLAHHVAGCVGCHSEVHAALPGEPLVEDRIGAGRDFGAEFAFPGRVRAPNLTPDPTTGLGSWSDGEILRAIREGISRDGRPLFPLMPYATYARTMSTEDALAVVAYLRSLNPIRHDPGPMQVDFPVSMFARAAPHPVEQPAPPMPTERLARGQVLLQMASCGDCHNTVDDRMEPIHGMALAGGQRFAGPYGVVFAPNITQDEETGLGAWTDEEIRRAVFQGVNRQGRALYAMPWTYYSGMTQQDRDALVAALRQVPAVHNRVPPAQLKSGAPMSAAAAPPGE